MILTVYHLHEHKLQADGRVTYRPSTDVHQCHTPTALSKTHIEESGDMPFLDQQSMRRRPLRNPKISQKFSS